MAVIAITDITDGTVDGDGSFDKLMVSVNAHLESQFTQNRIKGSDYANVYLGSLQTAMAQAIAFELGKQQADKQADQIAASTVATTEQSTQDLLNKAEQVTASIANTTRQNAESVEKVLLLAEQTDKVTAEELLVTQKTKSEMAQIVDVVDAAEVVGMIGKQKALVQTQTDGFLRDAEQKIMKIMMDSYAIRRSTDAASPAPSKAEDLDIDEVIIKAVAGIGVTLPQTWTVSVTVTELVGTGLIIQNNEGDDLTIDENGTFTFNTPLHSFSPYAITILSQPGTPTLYVQTSGTAPIGNIGEANVVGILINATIP